MSKNVVAESKNMPPQLSDESKCCRFVLPPIFTVAQAVGFKQSFQQIVQDSEHLQRAIFDFRQTTFMDSSGIGALVAAKKLAQKARIELVLQNVSEQVLMVLSLADLDRLFVIEPGTTASATTDESVVTFSDPVDRESTLSQTEQSEAPATRNRSEKITAGHDHRRSSTRKRSSVVSSRNPDPFITHPSVRCWPKRLLDIVGSIVGLLIVAVLFLPIAIAIKIDDPGPIFFGQTRCSRMGRRFKMWKFRSMVSDAEAKKHLVKNDAAGAIFKSEDDPRITRVGRFLRKTSLDEIPQFWNVLKGDMSLVGTRPPTPDEVERYEIPQWQRLDVKPGMTGEWQVNGRSSIKDFEDIVRLDLKYQENWSLLYDIQLILKTVAVLFNKKSGAM